MPGPGPGYCLRRGGGGGRASGWAPSLTLGDPARCSFSPSRLLLHLLLSARGGRQGAGAPGPRASPTPGRSGSRRPAIGWGAGTRGRSLGEETQGLTKRREEGTRRRTGPAPRAVLPSPAFPFSSPTRDICALRRAAVRGGALPRRAQAPGMSASRGGEAASLLRRAEGSSQPPKSARPRSSIGTQKYIHPRFCALGQC